MFQALLGLSRSFGAAELESVIVASVGDEGLLPDVHMVHCGLSRMFMCPCMFERAKLCSQIALRFCEALQLEA